MDDLDKELEELNSPDNCTHFCAHEGVHDWSDKCCMCGADITEEK